MLLAATQHGLIHILMNKAKCSQQAALHIPYKSLVQLCPPWSVVLPPQILWHAGATGAPGDAAGERASAGMVRAETS